MTPIQQPSPADILQWLQNNHTLHRVVEALYVVDGYQVEITHDGVRIAGPWHGETLFEAYAKGMADGAPKEDDVTFESVCQGIHDAVLAGYAKRINRHMVDVNTATRINAAWAQLLVRAGYAAGARSAMDASVPTAAATPSETWVVAKEHCWEHGDGQKPTLAYLLPSEFGSVTYPSFEAAAAFIKDGAWPLGFVAIRLDTPIPHEKAATGG